MYVYLCVCARVYVFVCLCVHACMYMCEYLGVCACVCLECMFVYVGVFVHVCMFASVCVCLCMSDLISFVCFTCKNIVACSSIRHCQHPSNPVHLSMTPIEHGMSSLKVMHIDYKLINRQRYFTTGAVTSFSGR